MKPWPKVRLGEVLSKSDETVSPKPDTEYREVTVRLWGKGVVERGRRQGAEMAGNRRFAARQEQFIVSRIDARNGAMGIVPKHLDGSLVTNDFPLFNLNRERLFPDFLGWLCRTGDFVELCQQASEGTTNRVRLKEDRFLALEIPLPPLQEQRRIVARIGELSSLIDEARTLRQQADIEADALADRYRAKLFEAAAKKGVLPLSQMASLERGKFSHRPRNDPRFFGGRHPWIQISEIESSDKYIRKWHETLNDDGLAISKKFPKGTILISIAATIGAVGILDFDCCVPDSIVGVTPKEGTNSEFLYHFLTYARTHLEAIAPQSAQKNINLQILSPLPVPNIDFGQQKQIAAKLNTTQGEMDALKQIQCKSVTEQNALLPAVLVCAFRGEL